MSATCRFCQTPLSTVVADLGAQPLSNSYLRQDQLESMERHYPLVALLCEACFLVQLSSYESPSAIFSDYAYFSSYSDSWLNHCRRHVESSIGRLQLDESSRVVEIASNDGYLLQYFVQRGIPAMGVEPAANVAAMAVERGVETTVAFFGEETAGNLRRDWAPADLILANNVLAHVPDLNDFVRGLQVLLADGGTISIEFPHLLRLMSELQFDTIYHEHFSYFSLLTVQKVFLAHGLRIFDVDELATHGGSLRIWGCHDTDPRETSPRCAELETTERKAGLADPRTYESFSHAVIREKRNIWRFFLEQTDADRSLCGYGAPAKGNTLLNYCGIGTDLLPFTVDLNPVKQGTYLPGSRIPVLAPARIEEVRPDIVVILPWNLREEITSQWGRISAWGGQFAARSPEFRIL